MVINTLVKAFEGFFNLLDVPIAIIDKEGTYLYYNEASADIDQIPRSEALGANMLTLYKGMNLKTSTMLQAATRGIEYRGCTQIYYNNSGNKVEYVHSTSPIYDDGGHIIGAIEIGLNKNISHRMTKQVSTLIKTLSKASVDQSGVKIIFESAVMKAAVSHARKISAQDVPVMIYGETGTGKELFAQLIHQHSVRKDKPFIALNCAAIPETLIESLMFGTEKGAYSGAEKHKGYIEMAEGGTLFLDEINSMPIDIQPKLLRYLQDQSYWRLGGEKEIKSNVRVIAAVNENPRNLVKLGKFRQDLFYRLCVGYVAIPALAERIDDIPVLANYFVNKYRDSLNHNVSSVSDEAIAKLQSIVWDGNVRMLESVLIRALIYQDAQGPLLSESINTNDIALFSANTDDQPSRPQVSASVAPTPAQITPNCDLKAAGDALSNPEAEQTQALGLEESLRQYERRLIVNAMNQAHGCISKAARSLNIHRSTLQYKLNKYAIETHVH